MPANRVKSKLVALVCLATWTALAATAQASGPVKLVLSAHIGWEVNKTTKGNFCPAGPSCQKGVVTSAPGGFEFPEGVAAASASGDLYVADKGNHRVQELTKGGEFVMMFGQDVNKTKVAEGATALERDVCTRASGDICGAGTEGTASGALGGISGIAVDPATEAVYVLDRANQRVDKYSANGSFLWMVGKEVNATNDASSSATEAEKNLCTAASGDECTSGVETPNSVEKCAFAFEPSRGDGLVVGGSGGHTVFVADAKRVQELGEEGECDEHEVKLPAGVTEREPTGKIVALAIDASRLDVVYGVTNLIDEFDITSASPVVVHEIEVAPQSESSELVRLNAIALDASGDLAVVGYEERGGGAVSQAGTLYNASGETTLFNVPGTLLESGVHGIGFDDKGNLYTVGSEMEEVVSYKPEAVAEATTGAVGCAADLAVVATDDTFHCLVHGVVNPFDVPNTEGWFEWGSTCGGTEVIETPRQKLSTVEEPLTMEATVPGARPNQQYCYRLIALDANVTASEPLLGATQHITTPTLAPRVVGTPEAAFLTSESAVLRGDLNPENAPTEYFVEYGRPSDLAKCADAFASPCAGVVVGEALESQRYGQIGATFEVTGLAADTAYGYRLNAVNFKGERAEGEAAGSTIPEAEFTTQPALAPEAVTGPYGSVGVTTAMVSGTVNPGGRAATYSFEVGVENGAQTRYGVVVTGSVPAVTTPVQESFALSGLQPGTHYDYRIKLSSSYVENKLHTVFGAPVVLVTLGLAEVLEVPVVRPQLPVPPIKFPRQPVIKKTLTRQELLVRALDACKKKPKSKRSECERQARRRYGAAAETKRKRSKKKS